MNPFYQILVLAMNFNGDLNVLSGKENLSLTNIFFKKRGWPKNKIFLKVWTPLNPKSTRKIVLKRDSGKTIRNDTN